MKPMICKPVLTILLLLALYAARAASVSLAWDASASTNVVAYRVYWGHASGAYTNDVQVGNVLTATVSNLVAGCSYYFAATAVDDSGLESDYSNEASLICGGLRIDPLCATNESGPWTLVTNGQWSPVYLTNLPGAMGFYAIGATSGPSGTRTVSGLVASNLVSWHSLTNWPPVTAPTNSFYQLRITQIEF